MNPVKPTPPVRNMPEREMLDKWVMSFPYFGFVRKEQETPSNQAPGCAEKPAWDYVEILCHAYAESRAHPARNGIEKARPPRGDLHSRSSDRGRDEYQSGRVKGNTSGIKPMGSFGGL